MLLSIDEGMRRPSPLANGAVLHVGLSQERSRGLLRWKASRARKIVRIDVQAIGRCSSGRQRVAHAAPQPVARRRDVRGLDATELLTG